MSDHSEQPVEEAEETILDILQEHSACYDQTAVFELCACGWGEGQWPEPHEYDEHLAGVLEAHQREVRARELEAYVQTVEYIDDVIYRGAEKDDRWFDFALAEKEFQRTGYNQRQDYVSATVHYAKYRAQQVRDGQINLGE